MATVGGEASAVGEAVGEGDFFASPTAEGVVLVAAAKMSTCLSGVEDFSEALSDDEGEEADEDVTAIGDEAGAV